MNSLVVNNVSLFLSSNLVKTEELHPSKMCIETVDTSRKVSK